MNRRDMLRLSAAGVLTAGFDPPLATSQDAKDTPDEMIHKYLAAEVERISKNFLDGAKTRAEWEVKRPRLKDEFLDMLGLRPLPEKTDLRATVTGQIERGDVVIEKLHFQSRPGLYVTANYYRPKVLPKPSEKKLPTVLYVCGHSGRGRDGNKTAFQDHGLWFASNGYVCLIVDTLQLGEVAGKHHGTYNLGRFWWHSRGYTPAGVECWNGIRAIDYLCTRPEVDPDRIGVTGISGGGATTVWIAAADDRVKVAVPVSGMSDLQSYVTNKVINGHCDCMFVHNAYQWEWTTILALFAPKPLLFANSDNDTIFPMDGNRRIVARLRQCYAMHGAKDKVDEYVSKGGHDYRPDLRIQIFGFFNNYLRGDPVPTQVKDADFPKIDGKELRVFPEDKDLPKDAINATVDEVFVPKAEVKLPAEAKDFAAWKAGLVKQLRERVFRALPEKVPAAERVPPRGALRRLWTESPGISVPVVTIVLPNRGDRGGLSYVILNPDENGEMAAAEWRERYPKSADVVYFTRGGGPDQWTRKNPPNTVERSLALIGQTADSGRVRDVAALLVAHSADKNEADDRKSIRLIGRGQAGVIATYAALLAPGVVQEVVILDPPASHSDGPYLLNVMRVLDIPEALGLLAPDVKLTLIGAKDKAFDKTAAIYKLAGAEAKFGRK
jgi:dienelactone hydrolase